MKYTHRKVQVGCEDRFRYKMENTFVSPLGIISSEPIDITGWAFKFYLHKGVELNPDNYLFEVDGIILNGKNGNVMFTIPKEYTNIPPATYWYTIAYTRPDGVSGRQASAKYIIVKSLNSYFDIYTNAPYVEKTDEVYSKAAINIALADLKRKVSEIDSLSERLSENEEHDLALKNQVEQMKADADKLAEDVVYYTEEEKD